MGCPDLGSARRGVFSILTREPFLSRSRSDQGTNPSHVPGFITASTLWFSHSLLKVNKATRRLQNIIIQHPNIEMKVMSFCSRKPRIFLLSSFLLKLPRLACNPPSFHLSLILGLQACTTTPSEESNLVFPSFFCPRVFQEFYFLAQRATKFLQPQHYSCGEKKITGSRLASATY